MPRGLPRGSLFIQPPPPVFGYMAAERLGAAHVQVLRQPGVAGLGGLLEMSGQRDLPSRGLAVRP